ncbi:hypothetical protein UP10_14110 [Bradyrhizobium sp. LTSPM299]|nr:hypothetical protein UP10_14110 [Bradyrhizobium sp. LTSPM299]
MSRAARETEGHKNRLDLGGQGQALMVGKLFASVPGQRPVKLARQSLRLLDQRRDDAFGVLVSNLDQHHVSRMAFDKRCNNSQGDISAMSLPHQRIRPLDGRIMPGIVRIREVLPAPLMAMTDRTGRTELRCLKCDQVDPMKTHAAKWAASPLAGPTNAA